MTSFVRVGRARFLTRRWPRYCGARCKQGRLRALHPPDHAIVLAVDEKSQIQAPSRTQPVLPMGLGYVEGVTQDYVRHGTTTLFAALDIAPGAVFTECKPRHRRQEFLGFLKRIDQAVPVNLDVHLIDG